MEPISSSFINALLADSSYADGLSDGLSGAALEVRLRAGLTSSLANFMAGNFIVASHVESSDFGPSGSGFDATAWRGSPGTPYEGRIFISMQGTFGFSDFLTDVRLALTGNAGQQVIDMVNWWLEISTPTGQPAAQYRYAKDAVTQVWSWDMYSKPGRGLISASEIERGIEVNGHSLGGYLASAFMRLLGSEANVTHVSTFNSAGFALGSESAFQEIQSVIGFNRGTGAFPTQSQQTNYFASHGISVTSANSFWMEQVGKRVPVFNELDLLPVGNHSMYKLTDVFSLGAALSKLDPSLTVDRLNALLEAASNSPAASIEGVFDALRKVLLGASVALTPTSDASSSSARSSYQQSLAQLQETAAFKQLLGQLEIKAIGPDVPAISQTDFSLIAALTDLSTMVLRAKGAAAEAALTQIWQATRSGEYAAWLSDKTASVPGTFTAEWLADRSKMLAKLVVRNESDTSELSAVLDPKLTDAWAYEDRLTHIILLVQPSPTAPKLHYVTFGGDAAETLEGAANEDHLYGGAGADTLKGLAGPDYLQGDAGDDTLAGGAGSDTLWGGSGSDTYQYTTGDGNDRITDSDGNGEIFIDGKKVAGGDKVADNVWQSEDRSLVFTLQGGNLVIGERTSPGAKTISGTISVADWQDGQLGISLPDTPPEPAPPSNILIGDQPPDPQHPTFQDNLIGTSGADFIRGLTNDDLLLGNGGNDSIDGGTGNDVLMGGVGADTLDGGEGHDLIYGSSTGSVGTGDDLPAGAQVIARGQDWYVFNLGADSDGFPNGFLWGPGRDAQPGDDGNIIDAGDGNDTILAGTGSDIVHGGADRDDITGMGGSDVLMGDAGDDRIYGDGPVSDASLVDYTPPDQQAADYIDGGEGNDILLGDGGDDEVYGDAGDDRIWGDDRSAVYSPGAVHGNDYLDGEDGNDQVVGGGRDDELFGGAGNDMLWGDQAVAIVFDPQYDGSDYLDGEDGNDTLIGGGRDDRLFGGEGNDKLVGDDTDESRVPVALHGNDYLDGEDGDDWLCGQAGNDTLWGGAGNDTLVAAAGSDVLQGGGGNDIYLLSAQASSTQVDTTGGAGVVVLPAGMGLSKLSSGSVDEAHADLVFNGGLHVTVNGPAGFMLGPDAPATYSQAQMAQLVRSALTAPAPAPGTPEAANPWLVPAVDVPTGAAGGDDGTGGTGGTGDETRDHTSYRADGSWSLVQTTSSGQTVTRNYAPQGTLLGLSTSRAEGGNTITSRLDATGRKVGENWTHADGTSGSDLVGAFDYNGMANLVQQSPARTMAVGSSFWGNNAAGTARENDGAGRGFLSEWWTPPGASATQGASGTLDVSLYATEYEHGAMQFDSSRTPVSQFASIWREVQVGYDVPQNAVRYDPATIAWYRISDNYTGITIDGEQQVDGSKTVSASRLFYDGTIDYQSPDGSFILWHSTTNSLLDNSYATTRAEVSLTLEGNEGTHAVVNEDGFGNVVVIDYDAAGNKVLDSWFHNDGSQGSDEFFADGSVHGVAAHADGSVVEFERDAQGHVTLLVRSGPNFALDTPANPVPAITPAPAPPQGHLGWGAVGAPASPPAGGPTELSYADANGGTIHIQVSQGSQTAYRTDASGNVARVDTDPGYAVESRIDDVSTRTWNYDAAGIATCVTIEAALPDGGTTTLICDWNGLVTGTRVERVSSPSETGTFEYDAQGVLTASSTSVAFGAGNMITSHFDAAGALVSYLVQTMPASNQTLVTAYDAQDRCTATVRITTNGNGVIETDNFDAQGNFTGSVVATPQADGSINTVNRDAQGHVSSVVVMASTGQGGTVITVYAADGHRLRSDALEPDGTQTTTEFALDGSSIATSWRVDGSTCITRDDGAGNVDTQSFDAAGVQTSELWARSDGAQGSETFAADGSSTGMTLYPDGSRDTSRTDSGGTLTTIHYGSDGSTTGSTVTHNTGGRTAVTNFDVGGHETTVQWMDANGSSGTDAAPVAGPALAAQVANQGTAWSYTLQQDAFSDADAGDALHYSVKLSNGASLPAWLSFDAASHTLRGTPGAADVGSVALTVTATDSYGLVASQSLSLRVNANLGLNLNGTNAADSLVGGAGNDTINGGAGWDTMAGGAGNDLYIVDSAADQVVELAGQGVDEIRSSVAYKLPANIERLVLTGSGWYVNGTGNELDNVIIGNAAANNLKGNAGNDTLDGGAGDDFLYGTVGNDTYVLGRGYGVDTITESDVTGGNKDIAQFAADISFNQLWFARAGNSLDVSVIGTGDRLHIDNWYSGQLTHVEEFRSGDGRVLSDTRVADLVQAMAGLKQPPMGTTALPADYVQILAPVFAADWI